MKRGKDGEKVMGPMFPRLHVNDAEKGGPRAPPRNKMALYEQLCVPSQRFSPGLLPFKPTGNNSVPLSSSSQVSGSDRKSFFPLHLPLSRPTFPEKINGLESDRYDTNSLIAQHGERNKSGDEDEFTVPVFARPREGQVEIQNGGSIENSVPLHSACEHHHSMRIRTQNSISKNLTESENVNGESEDIDKSSRESGNSESPWEIEMANASEPRRHSSSGTPRSDDASEACILDSAAAEDISPDEVVGIIGQKHFWKARRAIVNQQRVFAIQVFELHRLIKVQKLIAGSPNLLMEDTSTTTLSKPSSKGSPATKLSDENNAKSMSPATQQRDEPKKLTHPVECSAENAVGRNPVFPSKNTPSGLPAVSGPWGPQQPQPAGQQQWLIPVMSPTEGLVYKPCYPGPGFSGSSFCGPYGASPMMMGGTFGSPAYGVPAPQGMGFVPGIPQAGHSYFPTYGMPVISVGVNGAGLGSTSAVDQVNPMGEPTSVTRTSRVPRQEPDEPQLQSTRPAAPAKPRLQASKALDLLRSTCSSSANKRADPTRTGSLHNPSSPNEPRRTKPGGVSERAKDELQLFPTAPATAEADHPTRVIRAVPHNARSASASVARIFRSIQEERKHYDSV